MENKIVKKLGKNHEECVSAYKDIIAVAETAIDNFKRKYSNKISKQILEDSQNESFNKVVEAFGINSFAFYLYKNENQFIEYISFYKNSTELFSMDMNSSDFGRELISDLVLNEEDLFEAYESNLEVSDDLGADALEKIDLATEKFGEFLTPSIYVDFEKEVKSIEDVFLKYNLYQ